MTGRYAPHKSRRMLRRRRVCGACFSERGAPLIDARLPPEKIESILSRVAEGFGVRRTGRLRRVAPKKVAAGGHAKAAHDWLSSTVKTKWRSAFEDGPERGPPGKEGGAGEAAEHRIVPGPTRQGLGLGGLAVGDG